MNFGQSYIAMLTHMIPALSLIWKVSFLAEAVPCSCSRTVLVSLCTCPLWPVFGQPLLVLSIAAPILLQGLMASVLLTLCLSAGNICSYPWSLSCISKMDSLQIAMQLSPEYLCCYASWQIRQHSHPQRRSNRAKKQGDKKKRSWSMVQNGTPNDIPGLRCITSIVLQAQQLWNSSRMCRVDGVSKSRPNICCISFGLGMKNLIQQWKVRPRGQSLLILRCCGPVSVFVVCVLLNDCSQRKILVRGRAAHWPSPWGPRKAFSLETPARGHCKNLQHRGRSMYFILEPACKCGPHKRTSTRSIFADQTCRNRSLGHYEEITGNSYSVLAVVWIWWGLENRRPKLSLPVFERCSSIDAQTKFPVY